MSTQLPKVWTDETTDTLQGQNCVVTQACSGEFSHYLKVNRLAVDNHRTSCLVDDVLGKLSSRERRRIETKIAAITNADLVTAIRPFMFSGKVVHELLLDPSKLLFFTRREKIGAIASALIIASLAQNGDVPLSDQALRTHAKQIIGYGKHLKFGSEVSAFVRRVRTLEDEWTRDSFSDLPGEPN